MSALSAAELAYCACVLLAAYGLRGSTGFGGSVGMPLLALVVPIKILAPAWTLLGMVSSLAIQGKDRRHVDKKNFSFSSRGVVSAWRWAYIFSPRWIHAPCCTRWV